MRALIVLLASVVVSVAQLPPAPPSFEGRVSRVEGKPVLRSPKDAANQPVNGRDGLYGLNGLSLSLTRPALPLPSGLTNHVAPVASFTFRQVPGGHYGNPGGDTTNEVPARIEVMPWGHVRVTHEATAGKVYEIQVKFDWMDPQWWTYARVTAPKTDLMHTDHPIFSEEPQRFFRVRSD